MFSAGVERALRVALEAHSGQWRKGRADVPYAVHPLHVALIVRGFVDDEHVVQAALLHDVVEDCDGWTVERLRAEFGARVATLVEELTEDKSRSWSERKEASLRAVAELSPEAATIQACDKLHNLESLADDLRAADDPEGVWRRFKGGRAGTVAQARRHAAALGERVPVPLARALHQAVDELEAHAGGRGTGPPASIP